MQANYNIRKNYINCKMYYFIQQSEIATTLWDLTENKKNFT